MTTWLPSTTYVIIGGILGLIALGFALTMAFGVMQGMFWCLSSTSRLIAWLWAKLTGRVPESHGSSHWADESEIASKGLLTPGGLTLGTWQGKPLYEASGAHVAIIAPPRSWKSTSFLAPNIVSFDGSVFVNDPRGELWESCHVARAALGPTYRFSPTQKDSCGIDITKAIRWGEDEAYGDVQRLSHGLLSPDVGQPWDDFRLQASALLAPILMHCQSLGQGSLPGTLRWLTDPATSMKEQAAELSGSANPIVQAGGRRLKDILTSERTASIVWNHLISALEIYADPIVAANTDHNDVDLRSLQHGISPVSIFLAPPFSDVARLRPLLGTLTEMLTALFSAQQDQPRQKVALILDETANLGHLHQLERGQSYLQGCGVQIVQTWQNVLQCRQTYGPDSPILASVATKIYYTPSDQDTAEALSEELGVRTEQLRPLSETRSFWGLLQRTTIGTTEHARPLMTPDECRRMGETAAVVIVKGVAPILGTKLGTPAPELIDLAKPWVKRVAAVAAGLALVSVATWALWPKAPTPPPRLALTSDVGSPTDQTSPARLDPFARELHKAGLTPGAPEAEASFDAMPEGLRPQTIASITSRRWSEESQPAAWQVWTAEPGRLFQGAMMLRAHETKEACEADIAFERQQSQARQQQYRLRGHQPIWLCQLEEVYADDNDWHPCTAVKVAQQINGDAFGAERNFVKESLTPTLTAFSHGRRAEYCPQVEAAKAKALSLNR